MKLEHIYFDVAPLAKFKDNKFYMDTFNTFKEDLDKYVRHMDYTSYEFYEVEQTIKIVKEMCKLAEIQEDRNRDRKVGLANKGYEGFFMAEACRELCRRYGGLLKSEYGIQNTIHLTFVEEHLVIVLQGWERKYYQDMAKAQAAFDKIIELNKFVNNLPGA